MELLFNTRDELIKVDLRHVVFCEADDNYTHIYFTNGVKATLLCTLSNLEQLINEKLKGKVQPFIRIGTLHRKHFVHFSNQHAEKEIDSDQFQ